jgi:hypothetical protein
MKAVFEGKMGLEVVRTLKRVLTILSNISVMSDESFHRHLALTSQMNFNVRKK